MNGKRIIAFSALALVFLLFRAPVILGQCAMCRAVAESATDEYGNSVSAGINTGILYIMFIPYLLLAVVGWVFYRNRIRGFIRELREIHT